jgi:hypothetical protein
MKVPITFKELLDPHGFPRHIGHDPEFLSSVITLDERVPVTRNEKLAHNGFSRDTVDRNT